MQLDFSTIGFTGIIALLIIVTGISIVLFFVLRNVKALSIKTNAISLETDTYMTDQVKAESLSESKNYIKRQCVLIEHYIGVISGDLRELFSKTYDLTPEEKIRIWVLVDLFIARLQYQLINNFTENHIGKTQAEIAEYTQLRAREYTAYTKNFFDTYDWVVPGKRLKEAINHLPVDYFFTRLLVIYTDGKAIEK